MNDTIGFDQCDPRDELDYVRWEIEQLIKREREIVEQLADRENVDANA